MRLSKSIAIGFMASALAVGTAGYASAQTKPTTHKPLPQAPPAKSTAAVTNKSKAVAPVRAAETKPLPSKPTATKPAGNRLVATKSSSAKPANGKVTAAKPELAKAAAPKPAAAAKVSSEKKPVGIAASSDEAPLVSDRGLIAKRDPFVSLVNDRKETGGGPALPAGKAGLVVATVRVDGTVRSGGDLIAVVSNPERHVYFIRVGDQLYDGSVKKIDLDGVTFQENSKDAFGKPVVREITKRIYASAGDQQ